jgi:VIT1/CCC1 family predicted Fe2+/Mn2+ transporter
MPNYAGAPDVPRRAGRSWPSLQAFLTDFTLGFADGLTVPFALTAGLSSLGQTSTVIYAGMAEICAGSISMGIGGYLAARGEARAASASRDGEESESDGSEDAASLLSSDCGDLEKRGGAGRSDSEGMAAVARHLAPLRLPADLEEAVSAHLRRHGYDREALAEMASPRPPAEEEPGSSPVMTGLSVSLGYLVGGIIPLFPYFFVREVGTGLLCSFLVCILALFVFGFGKDFALNRSGDREMEGQRVPWSRIRSGLWEGFLMVVLGGTAAVAAVLCVRLFDGVL